MFKVVADQSKLWQKVWRTKKIGYFVYESDNVILYRIKEYSLQNSLNAIVLLKLFK